MELIEPSSDYLDSFLSALCEYHLQGIHLPITASALKNDFASYAELFRACEIAAVQDVPKSLFWLVDGQEYLGELTILHELGYWAFEFGGQIGYRLRPSSQGKGLGKTILRLGLEKAAAADYKRVLALTDQQNVKSIIILQKAGAVLDSAIIRQSGTTLRYWVAT